MNENFTLNHSLRFQPPSCLQVGYLVYARHLWYTIVSERERHHQAANKHSCPGHIACNLQSPHWGAYTSHLIIEKPYVNFLGLEPATSHW